MTSHFVIILSHDISIRIMLTRLYVSTSNFQWNKKILTRITRFSKNRTIGQGQGQGQQHGQEQGQWHGLEQGWGQQHGQDKDSKVCNFNGLSKMLSGSNNLLWMSQESWKLLKSYQILKNSYQLIMYKISEFTLQAVTFCPPSNVLINLDCEKYTFQTILFNHSCHFHESRPSD
jgi:hypothetical protein